MIPTHAPLYAALLLLPVRQGQAPKLADSAATAKQDTVGPARLRPLGQFVTHADPIRQPPTPGQKYGRVDLEKTLQAVRLAGVDTYSFLIWQGPNDLEDFKELLPLARQAGINMWASIVPPTWGGNSLPYKGDWRRWAEEMAKLAAMHSNLTALYIHDIEQGNNFKYLHGTRLADMRSVLNEAGISLIGGIYDVVPKYVTEMGNSLDGIVLCYTNTRQLLNLDGMLVGARKLAPAHWKILPGYWATPFTRDTWVPEPVYLYYCMRRAMARADGCLIYKLDLSTPSLHRPGRGGFSKNVRAVREFAMATRAGKKPQRPSFR